MLSVCLKEKKKSMRSETYRDKAVDSGEEPRDKEKNELKQKLNESEGMTEIKSGLTEEETSGNGGREKTLDGERERMRGEEKTKGRRMRKEGSVKEGKSKGMETLAVFVM